MPVTMMRGGTVLIVESELDMNRMSAAEYRELMGLDKPAENTGIPGNKEKKYYSRYSHPLAKNKNGGVRGNADQGDNIPRSSKQRNNEEDELTKQVASYCEMLMAQGKVTAFSHIPNSTFTKSWSVKKRNSAMGVRAGVPDMLIVFPDAVLFLELKRLKGGVVSEAQKCWLEALQRVRDKTASDVYAEVACGWDQAKAVIDSLLD